MLRIVKSYFPLFLIFFICLFLRTVNLGAIPYGFDRDEVANTYVGRFILENGRDLYGNTWPLLYFDKFGDYPPVLPMYLSGIATYLFGINAFAARFPAALLGSLLVFPLFFFVRRLFTERIALVSALMLTVLPWHIALSRAGAEGILALTICLTGYVLTWKGVESSRRMLMAGIVILSVTYLFYPAFRLLIPLIVLPLPLMVPGKCKKNAVFTMTIFIVLTVLVGSTIWGRGRFSQTSLFTNETDRSVIQNDLLRQIYSAPNQPVLLVRFFHNKYVGYTQRLVEQYFSYFTPTFWFIKGGLPERYTVPHLGLAYVWMGIFLAITLFSTSVRRNKAFWYIWYLLAVAPLPAVITVDDWPNIHRAIFMLIPVVILSAMGASQFYSLIFTGKTKTIIKLMAVGLFVLIGVESVFGLRQYFVYAGVLSSYTRTDGHVQMAEYLAINAAKYPRIFVTGDRWLSVYYLFNQQNFNKNLIGKIGQDFTVDTLDNITFTKEKCPSHEKLKYFKDQSDRDTLIVIDEAGCDVLDEYILKDTIPVRGGVAGFNIVTLKPLKPTSGIR